VIDRLLGESVLAAGVVSGTGLTKALLLDEAMPPIDRGVWEAFNAELVLAGLRSGVDALDSSEPDDARGMTPAEIIASEQIASTKSILNDGFNLTT
jgi:hypothetical protein